MTARPRGKGTPRPRADDGEWRDDWNTPEPELDLVRELAGRPGAPARIVLDPCWNRSAITNPTIAIWNESPQRAAKRDGLTESWAGMLAPAEFPPGVVFVNPPYSALNLWLGKCAFEAPALRAIGHYLVALVPARVEQPCWTDVVHTTNMIAFRHNRITFDHPEGKKASSAPMPVAMLIWSPHTDGKEYLPFGGRGWWCAEAVGP